MYIIDMQYFIFRIYKINLIKMSDKDTNIVKKTFKITFPTHEGELGVPL